MSGRLRDELNLARRGYESQRYRGDLAADVLGTLEGNRQTEGGTDVTGPRAVIGRIGWVVGAVISVGMAAAAAVLVVAMLRPAGTAPSGTGGEGVTGGGVVAAQPEEAVQDAVTRPVPAVAATPSRIPTIAGLTGRGVGVPAFSIRRPDLRRPIGRPDLSDTQTRPRLRWTLRRFDGNRRVSEPSGSSRRTDPAPPTRSL